MKINVLSFYFILSQFGEVQFQLQSTETRKAEEQRKDK